ncbi:hypothetical protein [Massilia sp. H6]|uniref:hypothetical protein n=1 Tax=Massilia sp. H6 TaxID=2970464 RepID=UPI0021671A9C|nr:hypothetical protein [Massilia sp. H6]UVW30537.1 hypothetical protein NRS07_19640 [Massilia sp. H6]
MRLLQRIFLQRTGGALVAVAAPLAIAGCMAAMNGGTALAAGPFDVVVTTLRDILASSWTIMLALVVLVVAIWQLAHGGGYKTVGLILGVLAIALVGPGFLTTISTSMPTAAQIQVIEGAHLVVQSVPAVLIAQR